MRKKLTRKAKPPYYYLYAKRNGVLKYKVAALSETFPDAMTEFINTGIFNCNFYFHMYKVDVGGTRTRVAEFTTA